MLAVVYLIFNEGYGGRSELAAEAIRLGGLVTVLMPDEPEAHGLLALMLLHDSRRDARFAKASSCCSPTRTALAGTEPDAAGRAALERALALRGRGPYVLQAAIAVAASGGADRLGAGGGALCASSRGSPAHRWWS